MKILLVFLLLFSLASLPLEARTKHGSGHPVQVKGYTKKNGTYVHSYRRTAPNRTKQDNWSHKGNVNPDTGRAGTQN